MFFTALFFPLLLSAVTQHAYADMTPTAPGPGAVFQEGGTCTLSWTADTSGSDEWKTMFVEFMAGDNLDMQYLTTIATVDGTDPNNASYSYTCLEVTPNAPIFFYQFANPVTSALTWTTRWGIESSSGQMSAAPNATQPNGDAIPWGLAQLVNQADFVAQPASGTAAPANSTTSSNSTASATSGVATGAAATLPVASSAATPTLMPGGSGTTGSGTASSSPSSAPAGANSANAALSLSTSPLAALNVIALAFATLF